MCTHSNTDGNKLVIFSGSFGLPGLKLVFTDRHSGFSLCGVVVA